MTMQPLIVWLRLATPLALSEHQQRHPLCLDAVLSGLLAARGEDPAALPLEVWDGLPIASQMFATLPDARGDAVRCMRRNRAAARAFNRDETMLAPNRQRGPGYIPAGSTEGQVKPVSTRYATIPEDARLYWFAHGDIAAVRRLLAWVLTDDGVPGYGLGRAANAGYGEAAEVHVVPLPAGWADAALRFHGRPTRPIPVARWQANGGSPDGLRRAMVTWHYPYYDAAARAPCVVPDFQILPGTFARTFAGG